MTFQYPHTWTLDKPKEDPGYPVIYLQEPGGIACYWSVAIRKIPPTIPLEQVVADLAEGMSTRYPGFKLREKGVVTAADGTKRGHVEFEYRIKSRSGGVQRQLLQRAADGTLINITEAGTVERRRRTRWC